MTQPEPQFQNSVDVKLDYLQRDLREVKADVKDIKNDSISRREYTDGLNTIRGQFAEGFKEVGVQAGDHETRIRALETRVWKFIGALVVCQVIILPVVLYVFYKAIR